MTPELASEIGRLLDQTAANLATKNDRYLMIILGTITVLGCALIIYQLAKFLEKLIDKQSQQTDKLIRTIELCNITMSACQQTLRENAEMISHFKLKLKGSSNERG